MNFLGGCASLLAAKTAAIANVTTASFMGYLAGVEQR
jgi:hypothetical protein